MPRHRRHINTYRMRDATPQPLKQYELTAAQRAISVTRDSRTTVTRI